MAYFLIADKNHPQQFHMKFLFFLAMLLPAALAAQKIALIDRGFKRPVLYTDSVTTEHLFQDYFPIHAEDLRTVIKTADKYIAAIDAGGAQSKMEDDIPAGRSKFVYTGSVTRRYTLHHIVLSTCTNDLTTSLKLVRFDDSRKRAIQKLLIFTDYVKNNLAVADEANKVY